ncbi:MAG: oligoendopeptidase F [Proteobacteria bacterium]|nr:oligoendopeptidase F [Pseudomonadota bacterium]
MSQTTIPHRRDVPVEETWDLGSVFPSVEAWEAAIEEVESMLPELSSFQGELAKGPETLVACIAVRERAFRLAGKVLAFGMLSSAVDTTNQEALARAGQGRGAMTRVAAATSFFKPELLSIGFDTLRRWMAEDSRLAVYSHYFDTLQGREAHVRSDEVEEVLSRSRAPLNSLFTAYSDLVNADLGFEPARSSNGVEMEVGHGSLGALITHADREVRRTAWENYADSFLAFGNTIASIQVGAIQGDVFNMNARRYTSSLQASLAPDNVPVAVFHNLVEVFKKNLPTWHRYWGIRRKALGYEKLHVYDITAPLVQTKIHIPYQQAVDWICQGMAPLGDEYVGIMRGGCTADRWVDRARNRGKRQGASSGGEYDTPPFVLMSYDEDIFGLSTLAHELGHSMHSYYTRRTQPFVYGRYSLFAAEVASNFNQAMVRDYLFKTRTDPAFQLALIEEAMANYHRYFFTMPTLARWELEMHERVEKGAPTNAAILSARCAELFQEGYGDQVEFDRDRIGISWAMFSHMYMNFYVFQYATGISGAHALADRILAGEGGAVERYLGFLKAGGSAYPLDALKSAGVDLTDPEPVEKAFGVLADIVDRLEALLKKGSIA